MTNEDLVKVVIGLASAFAGWLLAQLTSALKSWAQRRRVKKLLLEELRDLKREVERVLGFYWRELQLSGAQLVGNSVTSQISNPIFKNYYKDALLGLNQNQRISYQLIHTLVENVNNELRELRKFTNDIQQSAASRLACVTAMTSALRSTSPTDLHGSCHCGAIRLRLPAPPTTATSCNCSLCRRTAGIWAYYPLGSVAIEGHPAHTEAYVWGDRTLRNFRCRTCGVPTHWEPVDATPGARHGVNLRNFPPALLADVAVRQFDGADTWQFLD